MVAHMRSRYNAGVPERWKCQRRGCTVPIPRTEVACSKDLAALEVGQADGPRYLLAKYGPMHRKTRQSLVAIDRTWRRVSRA